jgi:hypothetical protein
MFTDFNRLFTDFSDGHFFDGLKDRSIFGLQTTDY